MLLQNFILLRMLMGHILLSPWSTSTCRKPVKRKGRIIYNCRIVATLIYEIVRMTESSSTLPIIGSIRSPGGMKDKNAVLKRSRSLIRSISLRPGNLKYRINSAVGNEEKKSEKSLMSQDSINTKKSTILQLFEKMLGISTIQPVVDIDDFKNNTEVPRNEIEELLLSQRNQFEPLHTLHGYLLKPTTLESARPLFTWLKECSEELDEWTTKLVIHVLNRRAQNIANKRTKKNFHVD